MADKIIQITHSSTGAWSLGESGTVYELNLSRKEWEEIAKPPGDPNGELEEALERIKKLEAKLRRCINFAQRIQIGTSIGAGAEANNLLHSLAEFEETP